MKEKLKLYSKAKLIDIIEKLSVESAIKNQQYEYLRHNNESKLQERIDKAIKLLENYNLFCDDNVLKVAINILKGRDKE